MKDEQFRSNPEITPSTLRATGGNSSNPLNTVMTFSKKTAMKFSEDGVQSSMNTELICMVKLT